MVWATARHDGHRLSRASVLRLLRDEGLILPAASQGERIDDNTLRLHEAIARMRPAEVTSARPTRIARPKESCLALQARN